MFHSRFSRRGLLKWLAGLGAAGIAVGTYGFVLEPRLMLRVQYYKLSPPRWSPGLQLRLVILADPHVAPPNMSLSRWQAIIETANNIEPDLHLLLGDYAVSHPFVTAKVKPDDMAAVCRNLKARLGTFAVMGNHDWWEDPLAQKLGQGPTEGQIALEAQGIRVLENKAQRLEKEGKPFWLSGTGSIVAIRLGLRRFRGVDDLKGTLAQITDEAPVIHLAHEPDLFVDIPERVSLTLSGHTHGGQVRIAGYSPIVPSAFGNRFAYGHIVENGRHLIVSGGLGCSMLPVRLGVPPEIVVIDLA